MFMAILKERERLIYIMEARFILLSSFADFKGGTYTTGAYLKDIAPFSQYELPNIQTNMYIEYGATYTARASLYASSKFNTTNAIVIGVNGVIELYEGGYIETEFTPETVHNKYGRTTTAGYTKLTFYGGAKDNELSLQMGIPVSTASCLWVYLIIFPLYLRTERTI